MGKAESMKIRQSTLSFCAFPGPDLLYRDRFSSVQPLRRSIWTLFDLIRRARAGRIPHSTFICLFFFTALFGVCFFSVAASDAASEVTVQPISEAALDELIKNKDNPLVVSFMAAWCGPCIDELPALNNLYRKYRGRGLNLIGISIDLEGAAAMQPVINTLKIEFPVYWYGDKAIQKFKLSAIPLLLIIKQGEIVEQLPGRRPEEFLDKRIKALLN